MFENIINFIKKTFDTNEFIPLHAPKFVGNEKKYLNECIDSTYVSYVGQFVTKFEEYTAKYTNSKFAIATANGTLALHASLIVLNVDENCEVLTQALTFVATVNAISYTKAKPVFIDSDETLGMCPEKLEVFLKNETVVKDDGFCYNKKTNKKIPVCVPVHIFGHPCKIDKIIEICNKYNITVLEDSAESLGSFYNNVHTGIFGKIGILSFNGNKIVTTGGGGMVLTNDEAIAKKLKYITTTAKIPHPFLFNHSETGYNYRMPNVNAAVGLAQIECLDKFLENKRELFYIYESFFESLNIKMLKEPKNSKSNYWLNAILLNNKEERDKFLEFSNKNNVMCRPIWTLMNKLPMFENCQTTNLEKAQYFEDRIVNIPSSIRL